MPEPNTIEPNHHENETGEPESHERPELIQEPASLPEIIEYWQTKAERHIEEFQRQKKLDRVQQSIDSASPDTNHAAGLNTAVALAPPEKSSAKLRWWLQQMWWKKIEKIQHPKKVAEVIDYLNHKPATESYIPYTIDGLDRKNIDRFCAAVEHPVLTLMALQSVDFEFSKYMFSNRENTQATIELARTIYGLEDVVMALGKEFSCKKIYDVVDAARQLKDQRSVVEQLRDPAARQIVHDFITQQGLSFSLLDLDIYDVVLNKPQFRDALVTMAKQSYYVDGAQIKHLIKNLEILESTDGGHLLARCGRAGLQLKNLYYQFDAIGNTSTEDTAPPERAGQFTQDLKKIVGEDISAECLEFIDELRAFGWTITSIYSVEEIKRLLPKRQATLATLTCLRLMSERMATAVSPRTLAEIVDEPNRLQRLLEPGYADFINRLLSYDIMLNSIYNATLVSSCVGGENREGYLRELYDNAPVREVITGPHAAEIIAYLTSAGWRMSSSYNITGAFTQLAEVSTVGLGSVLNRLRDFDIHYDDVYQLVHNKEYLHTLCKLPLRTALLDERFPQVMERAQHLCGASSDAATWTNSNQSLLDRIVQAATFFGTSPQADDILDATKTEQTLVTLETIGKTYARSVKIDSLSDFFACDAAVLATAPAYVELLGHQTTISLRELQLFATQQDVIRRGLERAHLLYPRSWESIAMPQLISFGRTEAWSLAESIIQELNQYQQRSPELIAAVSEVPDDVVALRNVMQEYFARDIFHYSDDAIMDYLKLIPELSTLTAVAEDYYAAVNRKFYSVSPDEALLANLERSRHYDRSVRQEAFRHIKVTRQSFDDIKNMLLIAEMTTTQPAIITAIATQFGADWKIDDPSALQLLYEDNYQPVLQQVQDFAHYNLPVALDNIRYALPFIEQRLATILPELKAQFGYTLKYEHIPALVELVEHTPDHSILALATALQTDFGLGLEDILQSPETAMKLQANEAIRVTFGMCRASGIDPVETYGHPLRRFDQWEKASRQPERFAAMLRLYPYLSGALENIDNFGYFIDKPDCERYFVNLCTTHHLTRADLSIAGLPAIDSLYRRQHIAAKLTDLYYPIKDLIRDHDIIAQLDTLPQADGWAALNEALALGEQVPFSALRAYPDFVARNLWPRYVAVRERFGIPFETALKDFSIIEMFDVIEHPERTDTQNLDQLREHQLQAAQLMQYCLDHSAWQLIDTAGDGSAARYIEHFVERYHTFNKGKTILTLLMAREYRGQPFAELISDVITAARTYESVLQRGNPDHVPAGAQASIGMEYEIVDSNRDGYETLTARRVLRHDLARLSTIVGIPQGAGGYYEIATNPTDNPYALLLEMKLLQDLGFIDFNFSSEHYNRGAHGYHLTLGGEHGIGNTPAVRFLQNALMIAGWGGVNTGNTVDSVSSGRPDALRERGSTGSKQVFSKSTNSTELRTLSIDQWEPFERAVTTAHVGAIAIQVAEKYFTSAPTADWKMILQTENFPNSPQALHDQFMEANLLREPITDDRTKHILYEWMKLQAQLGKAVRHHNEAFLETELYGYEAADGTWVETNEFGGEGNEARFTSVVQSQDYQGSLSDYAQTLHIPQESLYEAITPDIINALTRTTNLFLKPAVAGQGDRTNAVAALHTTKLNQGRIEDGDPRAVQLSVFDQRTSRRGYYNYQGGSERMLLHASQRALLQFKTAMEEILMEAPTVEAAVETLNQVAA